MSTLFHYLHTTTHLTYNQTHTHTHTNANVNIYSIEKKSELKWITMIFLRDAQQDTISWIEIPCKHVCTHGQYISASDSEKQHREKN